ncbi:MAG: hypothetical protein ACXWID_15315 [Pyrinomonadaceae bacterium]
MSAGLDVRFVGVGATTVGVTSASAATPYAVPCPQRPHSVAVADISFPQNLQRNVVSDGANDDFNSARMFDGNSL